MRSTQSGRVIPVDCKIITGMPWLVYGSTMQIARKPFEPESARHAELGWQSCEKAPRAPGGGEGGGLSGRRRLGRMARCSPRKGRPVPRAGRVQLGEGIVRQNFPRGGKVVKSQMGVSLAL